MDKFTKLPSDCEITLTKEGLTLLCDSADKLRSLLKEPQAIALWAFRFQAQAAYLKYPIKEGFRVFEVPVSLAAKSLAKSSNKSSKKPVQKDKDSWVFSEGISLNTQLIRTLFMMAESEKPMALVKMDDDRLLWLNQPMTLLLETPALDATKRNMKDFWLPGDLEQLKNRCQQETRFTHTYEAALNENLWADLEASFDIIDGNNGEFYRLSTNLYSQPKLCPKAFRADSHMEQ